MMGRRWADFCVDGIMDWVWLVSRLVDLAGLCVCPQSLACSLIGPVIDPLGAPLSCPLNPQAYWWWAMAGGFLSILCDVCVLYVCVKHQQ